MPKVLFETKCWERDWQELFDFEFQAKYDACNYPFDEKWIIINNVDDADYVACKFAPIVDKIVIVEDIATDVLEFFNIKYKSFDGNSYVYSIAELASLYFAEDFDYLCHFAGDVRLSKRGDWITKGIEVLESRDDIIAVSPAPDQDYLTVDTETTWFSDQAYLIRVKDWRSINVFNHMFPPENQYPAYGGNSFERRAGRYMINNNKKRMWLHNFTTLHPVL